MNYIIEPIDITDPEVEEQIRKLFKTAFPKDNVLPHGHLYNNTVTKKASGKTFFLAAKENNVIIGCCGFMATDFIQNGKIFDCYQAVWAATHPIHQGKGIFGNLINEGKKIGKERGAGFMYALAGDSSHFIFIKKLGFKEIPSVGIKIPNIPFLRDSYFEKTNNRGVEFYKTSSFCPVEGQIVDLKRNTGGEEVLEVRVNNSFLWGRLKKKHVKFGITLSYFYVGGIELNAVNDFKPLFDRIFKEFKIQYVQIVSCKTNLYNHLLKNWQPTKMHGFIFYELNVAPVENVNIFYGAIDVF